MTGKIRMINREKGYGFITGHDNQDFFFHVSELKSMRLDELTVGDEVSFEDEEGTKGRKAVDIVWA